MTFVQTVLGQIAPEKLGLTLPHEHIICDSTLCRFRGASGKRPHWGSYMWFDEVDVMTEELNMFRMGEVPLLMSHVMAGEETPSH